MGGIFRLSMDVSIWMLMNVNVSVYGCECSWVFMDASVGGLECSWVFMDVSVVGCLWMRV